MLKAKRVGRTSAMKSRIHDHKDSPPDHQGMECTDTNLEEGNTETRDPPLSHRFLNDPNKTRGIFNEVPQTISNGGFGRETTNVEMTHRDISR
jgi:hypothetical protein